MKELAMVNTLLIILPLLIPAVVLGHFFVRLFSRRPDKYEHIYRTFLHINPAFVPGGHRCFARPLENTPCDQS
jgi:hypothetical protein